jgi:hypothetical protein
MKSLNANWDYPSVVGETDPAVCLSVCLSVCLFVCLSVCLSVCLCAG